MTRKNFLNGEQTMIKINFYYNLYNIRANFVCKSERNNLLQYKNFQSSFKVVEIRLLLTN